MKTNLMMNLLHLWRFKMPIYNKWEINNIDYTINYNYRFIIML